MKITITKGSGTGVTELASFDKALFSAGIANYNLIRLSSVIPKGSEIIKEIITKYNDKEYGYKLYVVMADYIQTVPGKHAVAGIGWVKHPGNNNSGLFVEFGGDNENEIREKIISTLTSMCSYRPEEVGEIEMEIESIECVDAPVCAVVSAVYKSEGWSAVT